MNLLLLGFALACRPLRRNARGRHWAVIPEQVNHFRTKPPLGVSVTHEKQKKEADLHPSHLRELEISFRALQANQPFGAVHIHDLAAVLDRQHGIPAVRAQTFDRLPLH